MFDEKFRIPQIEYDAPSFSNAVREPSKHIAISFRIKMPKALAHHDCCVERIGLGLIIADVGDDVIWSMAKFACSCNCIRVTIDPGYRITVLGKRASMPSDSATNIQNLSKIRQRRTFADKIRFPNCPRLIDTDVKEVKPLPGIEIWF